MVLNCVSHTIPIACWTIPRSTGRPLHPVRCSALLCAARCAALRCAALCYAAIHCTMLRCATLHCATSRHAALYCAMLPCTAPFGIAPRCGMLRAAMLRCTALCCVVQHSSAPHSFAVLCCAALLCCYPCCCSTGTRTSNTPSTIAKVEEAQWLRALITPSVQPLSSKAGCQQKNPAHHRQPSNCSSTIPGKPSTLRMLPQSQWLYPQHSLGSKILP